MAYDKFLIAPIEHGLRDDLTSWLIPDDAFTRLNNAYVFRGRVKKRFGTLLTGATASSPDYQNLNSRLRIELGTTDGSGNISGTIPGADFSTLGRTFSIDDTIYTIYQTGTPANMFKTDATTTATYDTTSGAYIFVGAPASKKAYFYPTEPVMGFVNYEKGPVNEHDSFAFDKQFVYKYSGSAWERNGTTVWKGDESEYFWSTNWQGITADAIVLFTTNFNVTLTGAPAASDDPIYFYNGATWADFSAYTKFNSSQDIVTSAKIIVPFKNRLVLLNVVEKAVGGPTNTHFVNRVRYSHNGSPLAANAWLEPNTSYGANKADGAGYIDAPTEEEIMSVAFIKDRLIVFFERSTYELVYTGNEAIPFVWQAINSTLGSEATHSTVIFDKNVITVGTTGINSCDGARMQRIDEEIPNKVYEILKTTAGTKKIVGVRDYFNEMVYWSFLKQSHSSDNSFNDSLMVYNYRTGNWSLNDDSFSAFGYLEQEKALTNANSKQVLCGNHQGFISVIDSDEGSNAESLIVTNMSYLSPDTTLTIYNHNLRVDDYIKVQYPQGLTDWVDGIFKVKTRVDANNIKIETDAWTGTYTGGGIVSKVSKMEIETKDLNPYVKEGNNLYLAQVEFNIDKTTNGEVTINYNTSTSSLNMISEAEATGANLGTSILETRPYKSGVTYLVPLEEYQDKLWHRIYIPAEGEFVKIKISLSDTQMIDKDIAESTFTLNGMILHTQMSGR